MPVKKGAPQVNPVERVRQSFPKLKEAAALLSKESDKLNESANDFNLALKQVGIGISAWVDFASGSNEDAGVAWSQSLGYTKLGGKWGLAIKSSTHDFSQPDPENEYWVFAEAPRALRVKAAPFIPDLLDQLIQEVARTTKEVSDHTHNIEALTATIMSEITLTGGGRSDV
jgi:hypothetical protein